MLHAFASRFTPYGYGSRCGPSHASVHSLSVHRRLPTALHAARASFHDVMNCGIAPLRLGHSKRSTQNFLWVVFMRQGIEGANSAHRIAEEYSIHRMHRCSTYGQ